MHYLLIFALILSLMYVMFVLVLSFQAGKLFGINWFWLFLGFFVDLLTGK